MPKFQKGVSGNPGGRPRAGPEKVDLIAEIRRQLAVVDPVGRRSKGAELVQSLITAGCGGDVRACQELLSRMHGKLGPPEPAEKLDLETIARAMQAKDEDLERERELIKRGLAAGLPANFEFGPDGPQLDEHELRRKVEEAERRDPSGPWPEAGERPQGGSPRPLPNGLVELPMPDDAYLAAQRVDEERATRERAKQAAVINPKWASTAPSRPMSDLDRFIAEAEEEANVGSSSFPLQ